MLCVKGVQLQGLVPLASAILTVSRFVVVVARDTVNVSRQQGLMQWQPGSLIVPAYEPTLKSTVDSRSRTQVKPASAQQGKKMEEHRLHMVRGFYARGTGMLETNDP